MADIAAATLHHLLLGFFYCSFFAMRFRSLTSCTGELIEVQI